MERSTPRSSHLRPECKHGAVRRLIAISSLLGRGKNVPCDVCRDCLRSDGIMGQSWFHSGGRETRRLSPRSFTSSLQPHLELPYGGTSRGVQRAGSKLLLQSITALCFPPEFWGLPLNLQTISRKKEKVSPAARFSSPKSSGKFVWNDDWRCVVTRRAWLSIS